MATRPGARDLESELLFSWNGLSSVFQISHALILPSAKANNTFHFCLWGIGSVDISEQYCENRLLNTVSCGELETLISHSCDLNVLQAAIVEEPVSERKA